MAGAGWREFSYYLLPPIVAGTGMLDLAYQLHKKRMRAPLSRDWVMALNGTAACLLLCSCVVLTISLLVKAGRRLPPRMHPASELFAAVFGFFVGCALAIPVVNLLVGRYSAVEARALEERGRIGTFGVDGRQYKGGMDPQYIVSFRVLDQHGSALRLTVRYSATDSAGLKPTVRIRYLPENPAIFQPLDRTH